MIDRPHFVLPALLLLAVAGCNRSTDSGPSAAERTQYQEQFVLSDQPAGAQTVAEVHDALVALEASEGASEGAPQSLDVVITGLIGGVTNPYGKDQPDFPWRSGQAVFFLVDAATAADQPAHDHANGEPCPFCEAHASELVDKVALVQLLDEADNLLPYRADTLLGLTDKSTLTVAGKARRVGEVLIVEATALYVDD